MDPLADGVEGTVPVAGAAAAPALGAATTDGVAGTTGDETPATGAAGVAHTRLLALARELGMSVSAFAHRLGVTRRTLYLWPQRGCPLDSEAAVRAWAAHCRIRLKPAPDRFADLLAPAAPVRAEIARMLPAGQEQAAPRGDLSPQGEVAAETAALRRLQSTQAEIDIAEKRRLLIARDLMVRGFGALGVFVAAEVNDLPTLALRQLVDDFPAEHRTAVRRAVAKACELLTAKWTAEVRATIERTIGEQP